MASHRIRALLVLLTLVSGVPSARGEEDATPRGDVTGVVPPGTRVRIGDEGTAAGGDGVFRLAGVPRDAPFDLEYGPGDATAGGTPVILHDLAMPEFGALDLGALPGPGRRRMAVTVTDEAGVPLPGAEVTLTSYLALPVWRPGVDPAVARRPSFRSRSGEDGAAVLQEVPAGRGWIMLVRAPGRVAVARTVEVSPDGPAPAERFELATAVTLRGTVLDGEGRPLAGARVFASKGTGFLPHVPRANCDKHGRFLLEGLAPGPVDLSVVPSPERIFDCGTFNVPAVTTVDLRLDVAGTFHVRVVDGVTGKPIAGARAQGTTRAISLGHRCSFQAATDATGLLLVQGLPPGWLQSLAVTAESHETRVDFRPEARSVGRGSALPVSLPLTPLPAADRRSALAGTVTGPDGRPVVGARVDLQFRSPAQRSLPPPSTVTTMDGAFRFEGLPPGRCLVVVTAEGLHQPGLQPSPDLPEADRPFADPRDMVDLRPGGAATVAISLASTGTLAGIVVDGRGRPVPGVEVSGTRTDGDGRFTLRNLQPRTPVRLSVNDPGWHGSAGPFTWIPGEDPGEIRVPVESSVTVSGTVLDADGGPVRGARVALQGGPAPAQASLASVEAGSRFPARFAAVTDAAGRFAIPSVPRGSIRWRTPPRRIPGTGEEAPVAGSHLLVSASGFAPAVGPVPAAADDAKETGTEILLAPGVVVEGTVRGPGGAPVSGAHIRLLHPTSFDREGHAVGHSPGAVAATTGGDGRFAVRDLPPGPRTLFVEAAGRADRIVEVEPGRPVDIAMESTVAMTGGVIDATTGDALAGFSVSATPVSPGVGLRPGSVAITGEDGSFRIDGLDPVPHRVLVSPPAGSDWIVMEQVEAPRSDPPIRLAMRRGRPLGGIVVDATGAPVAGVPVLLSSRGRTTRLSRRATEESGPDGRFLFHGLDAGTWNVSVDPSQPHHRIPGREDPVWACDALDDVEAGRTDLVFTVRRCLPVSGRIVDPDGRPVSGPGTVTLHWQETMGRDQSRSIALAADGSFRTFPLDPAGTWNLRATNFPGTAGALLPSVVPGTMGIEFRLTPGVSLSGRAVDQDGAPLPAGTLVRAEAVGVDPGHPGRTGSAGVGEDGRFTIPHLWKLPFHATVLRGGDFEPEAPVECDSGRDDLILRATRMFSVTGRVVDSTGNAVPLVRSLARAPGDSRWTARGSGDEEGRFRIDRIPLRTVEIGVVARGRTFILGTCGLPARDLVLTLTEETGSGPDGDAPKDGTASSETPRTRPEPPAPRPSRTERVDPPGSRRIGGSLVVPGPISGRLCNVAGTRPEGAQILVYRLDDLVNVRSEEPVARVEPDEKGNYTTPHLDAGRYEVCADGPGWKPQTRRVESGRNGVDMVLAEGLSVRGVVVDGETGAPVPGIPVALRPVGAGGGYGNGVTAADGTFDVGYPPPGLYEVLVGRWHDHRSTWGNEGDYLSRRVENVANGTSGLRVELRRGAALAGMLRDREGRPLPPEDIARIRLMFQQENPDGLPELRTVAGAELPKADGGFRFGGLPPGRYDLTVEYRESREAAPVGFEPVTLEAGATVHEVRVHVGDPVAGRVELPEGMTAPPGLQVEMRCRVFRAPATSVDTRPGGRNFFSHWLPVSRDLTFRSPKVDGTRSWDLFVRVPGLLTGEARGVACGTEDVVLVPGKGGTISGIVTDETGAPVPAGVPVTAQGLVPEFEDMNNAGIGGSTTEGGRFRLEGANPSLRYRLSAGGQGTDYLPNAQDLLVGPGDSGVVLRLRRGCTVTGVLKNEEGKPLPWTLLFAVPVDRGELPEWYSFYARVDAEGRFRIPGLPPGAFHLHIGPDPGKAAVFGPFDAPAEGLEIVMKE